ncbi:alpha-hydroxy acid oxidase [Phaeobacter sp.]|uniref:alpha-hydroxy acid oxidase n=1 Tax=Phaeobacter sp. TaxID=1902409 RepID=UPI0025D31C3B|nr:alpha-hydroxy acid oxidase [Phaeobacter sp.]
MRAMDLHLRYPALSDLRARAKRRLPRFVWEYLDSGTGPETSYGRNRAALDQIGFSPSILHGEQDPDLSVSLFGQSRPLPFGIAPVGMSGLIWPDAEGHLARCAAAHGIPYCLSTVASQSPEDLAPHLGANPWFQLYPPKDPQIRLDMLQRAKDAGFMGLVLTADVPVASRRERLQRSGLTQPPRLTPRLLAQVALRPAWALATARRGMPHMRTLDKYVTAQSGSLSSTAHVGYLLRTSPDWAYLAWLRDHWDGRLIVKGVLRCEDIAGLEAAGVDAIWVSSHAGRQFDAAPAAIDVLPQIRAQTRLPLIFDTGVESGLDVLRALALGADYVMMARGFHLALAALGARGLDHFIDILKKDMLANMGQMGAESLGTLPKPQPLAPFASRSATYRTETDPNSPP